MRRFPTIVAVIAVTVLGAMAAANREQPKPTRSMHELQASIVIGKLGLPLGEVVTIVGRWKSAGKGFDRFMVREADGRVLDPLVEFAENLPRQVGARTASGTPAKFDYEREYRLRAYETAVFDGFRSEWYDETGEGIPQSHSYGLRSRVVVLKNLTKAETVLQKGERGASAP